MKVRLNSFASLVLFARAWAPARAPSCAVPAYVAQAGFTLIELMIVMVLVAILLGVAGPSFQDSLQRNRMQAAVNSMATALSFARAEAVIRSEPVALCPTVDTASCSGSNWETGWLVFVDNGAAGAGAGAPADGNLNGSEELLRIGEPAGRGVTIRSVNFPSTANIVFQDSGRVQQNISGTVTICDARGANDARALIVEVSGQARRAVDTDANGVVEDDNVTSVVCP